MIRQLQSVQHRREQNREVEELRSKLNGTKQQLNNLQNRLRQQEQTIAGLRIGQGTGHEEFNVERQGQLTLRKTLKRNRKQARELLKYHFNEQLMSGLTFSLPLPFAQQIKDFIWTVSQLRI